MEMRRTWAGLVALLALAFTVSCTSATGGNPPTSGGGQATGSASPAGSGSSQPAAGAAQQTPKVPVIAAFYPLYEINQAVGGDRVDVTNLVAAGGEPHDFDPSPRDLERLQRTKVLVYVGEGFQPGLEQALTSVQSSNYIAVDVLEGMQLLKGGEHEDNEEEADHGDHDPHVWLDPVLFQGMVTKVRDALIQADPAGKDTYTANAQRYTAKLQQLDQEFRQGLATCARRDFVTSHAAFSYLAHRYDLHQIPISGLSPEAEPSPARMKQIVDTAKERKITVIFFETLVSPKVAEVVAQEIGAKTLVLNPLEGLTEDEQRQGKGYLEVMRQNLANLKVALECR